FFLSCRKRLSATDCRSECLPQERLHFASQKFGCERRKLPCLRLLSGASPFQVSRSNRCIRAAFPEWARHGGASQENLFRQGHILHVSGGKNLPRTHTRHG